MILPTRSAEVLGATIDPEVTMQTLEYRTVDKSGWGEGPWKGEPDKMQWQDEATKLPCLIVRNAGGALCGYVGVAEGHPLYGKGYEDFDVDVHGGLTFADKCADFGNEAEHICHVPAPDEPQHVWWFGFDCAHGYDLSPRAQCSSLPSLRQSGTYKDVPYVKAQIAQLAQQLAQVV